jgi:hypothetical protein
MRRSRAEAPLAIALEIARNELGRHAKQAMIQLSDQPRSSRQAPLDIRFTRRVRRSSGATWY